MTTKRANPRALANDEVRARINRDIKKKAASILEISGLSNSDACRMILTKIAREGQVPFDLFTPNAETLAAMKDAEEGRGIKVKDTKDLLRKLNA
jgi:DNA-damage-inducible protein J